MRIRHIGQLSQGLNDLRLASIDPLGDLAVGMRHQRLGVGQRLRIRCALCPQVVLIETLLDLCFLQDAIHEVAPHRVPASSPTRFLDVAFAVPVAEQPRADPDRPRGLCQLDGCSRVRFSVTAGTVYGTIATSVYNGSSLTTITIGGGEGPLDSGLSSVSYGFLAALNPSLPSGPITGSSVKHLVALNNTGTPNTKMDMSALAITFIHPATGGTYTKLNQAVLTNDIRLTGPAANGRDQSAAFTTTQTVHF